MNVYPLTIDAALDGDIRWLTDTFKALIVTDAYVYSAAHNFLDDVPAGARLGTAVTITGKSRLGGECFADDVTIPAVAAGDTVSGIIIYRDTGSEATTNLVAFIDRYADGTPIGIETNDGPITFHWPSRVFKL